MKRWARYSPANYQHKYELVQAETMRLSGQNTRAMDYYDAAIEGAKENKYIQEEAIANELAANFYFAQEKYKIGKTYLQDAYYHYQMWGAKRKLADLEQQYHLYTTAYVNKGHSIRSEAGGLGGAASVPNLDMLSILKASQTLSSEVVLGNLLKK
ncbi:MAG: hypothetical protein HC880_19510 [Bacteroidia bacterium]|nr:hypothetical protein [Bacteroidia bacterium]